MLPARHAGPPPHLARAIAPAKDLVLRHEILDLFMWVLIKHYSHGLVVCSSPTSAGHAKSLHTLHTKYAKRFLSGPVIKVVRVVGDQLTSLRTTPTTAKELDKIEQGTPNDEFRSASPIIINHSLIGVRYSLAALVLLKSYPTAFVECSSPTSAGTLRPTHVTC